MRSTAWVEQTFGQIPYAAGSKRGSIVIAPAWTAANIIVVPNRWGIRSYTGKLARIECHRLAAPRIVALLDDLERNGLLGLIKTWDGCFVPRHKCWNPTRTLSRHSWGIAVDLNASRFPYGVRDWQDSRLIATFHRYGFEWGGDWSTPDPMHFELISLDSVPSDLVGVKVVVSDKLVSTAGRIVAGQAEGPLAPILAALGYRVTVHEEQQKIYVYPEKRP